MPFTWNPYELSHPIEITPGRDLIEIESLFTVVDELDSDSDLETTTLVKPVLNNLEALFASAPQRCLFDLDDFTISGAGVEYFLRAGTAWATAHQARPQWILTSLPQMPFLIVRYDRTLSLIGLEQFSEAFEAMIVDLVKTGGFDTIMFDNDQGSFLLHEQAESIKQVILLDPYQLPSQISATYHLPLLIWTSRGTWIQITSAPDLNPQRITDLAVQKRVTRILMDQLITEVTSWTPALNDASDPEQISHLLGKLTLAFGNMTAIDSDDDESDADEEIEEIEASDIEDESEADEEAFSDSDSDFSDAD